MVSKNIKNQNVLNLSSFLFFLFIVCTITSCLSRNKEYENHLMIYNSTEDTIFYAKKYRSSKRSFHLLEPYQCRSLGSNYYWSIFEMIKESYQKLDVEIEIYKLSFDTCEKERVCDGWISDENSYYIEPSPIVTWSPPLVSLPDSIHSFYNINSWELVKGGNENKWVIATFTITEEDLKKKNN